MTTDTPKSIIFSQNETTGIAVIAKEDLVFYLKTTEMMLAKLMTALNVKANINAEQLELIPQLLISEYPAFRLNDVWMVCKNIMLGKYKMFERLDVETFFRCVREYDASDERITAREQFHQQSHHNKQQACETFKQFPKEVQEAFTKKKEKPLDTSAMIPMNFATDKDSMKKIRTDERK